MRSLLAKGRTQSTADWRRDHVELSDRIEDALKSIMFLQLEAQQAAIYERGANAFGDEVAVKFPSIQYEIDEAHKCLALGRSTAAAFHALRLLEAGITAMSRCLGIADPTKPSERSWAKMRQALDAGMTAKWPTTADRMTGDGRFFEEAYAGLAAMNNPWRNATMHLDQKYTEEEAVDVVAVVGAFMRKLASRLDEDGNPKA